MNPIIKFYNTKGHSLHAQVPHLDINKLIPPVHIYNDQRQVEHEYYSCGKIKPQNEYPLFAYYIENNTNFHIFVADALSYRYDDYDEIGKFLTKILPIHFGGHELGPITIYLPNITTPVTQLSFGQRLSSEINLLKYLPPLSIVK
jgi:hypothetical protein